MVVRVYHYHCQSLNDGGVWITKRRTQFVEHVVYSAEAKSDLMRPWNWIEVNISSSGWCRRSVNKSENAILPSIFPSSVKIESTKSDIWESCNDLSPQKWQALLNILSSHRQQPFEHSLSPSEYISNAVQIRSDKVGSSSNTLNDVKISCKSKNDWWNFDCVPRYSSPPTQSHPLS